MSSIIALIEKVLDSLKKLSNPAIKQLMPDLRKVAMLLEKIASAKAQLSARGASSSGASTSASGRRQPPPPPPTTTTTTPRTPGESSQSSGSGRTGRKRRRDGEGEEEPQLKRRRVVPGEKRNYHPRANRFTTQSQATTTFTVTEAARTKKPTEENIDRIIRTTTSRIVPTINIHDDPPNA